MTRIALNVPQEFRFSKVADPLDWSSPDDCGFVTILYQTPANTPGKTISVLFEPWLGLKQPRLPLPLRPCAHYAGWHRYRVS